MGHLSPALPVALDLTDRLVVLFGGGPDTGRVLPDLLAEGAVVRVVAPWICEDVQELAIKHPERVSLLPRDYAGPADLEGAWLALAATGDPSTDRAIHRDCDEQRLWCLAGESVESPTARAGLLTRTRVATPDGTVQVAVHADADRALALRLRHDLDRALRSGTFDLRTTRPRDAGWVALVGGGPGSDGLLTTRGHELLSSADVVVIDRLAPRGVVATLPASVRIIDVGKTPGHHPVPQDRINDILVEEAQRGLGVVRLKGGDPYVLGRGGEERLACEAHGIPVEVVPGVTSAVSVPAAAGIPLTHRHVAKAFTVVTGHEQIPNLPGGSDHTLVFLMGVSNLRLITDSLVAQGRSPDCPVAIIERGFLPDQRVTIGTLGDIAEIALWRGVESPAVTVVGDVVRLATVTDD